MSLAMKGDEVIKAAAFSGTSIPGLITQQIGKRGLLPPSVRSGPFQQQSIPQASSEAQHVGDASAMKTSDVMLPSQALLVVFQACSFSVVVEIAV